MQYYTYNTITDFALSNDGKWAVFTTQSGLGINSLAVTCVPPYCNDRYIQNFYLWQGGASSASSYQYSISPDSNAVVFVTKGVRCCACVRACVCVVYCYCCVCVSV